MGGRGYLRPTKMDMLLPPDITNEEREEPSVITRKPKLNGYGLADGKSELAPSAITIVSTQNEI